MDSAAPEAEALVAIIRRLSTARTLAEVTDVTTHAARILLRADGITFVLRDGDQCYYAEEDAIGPLWKGRRFPMSACISGWCMANSRAVAIADIYQDPRIPHDAYRPTFVRSLAMAPVRQEQPIAALGAYWSAPRAPTDRDVELLQTIANAAALAIALVELKESRAAAMSGDGAAAGAAEPAARGIGEAIRSGLERLGLDRERAAADRGERALPRPAELSRSILVGLGFAAAAWAVRAALGPLVGTGIPYAPFFLAVLLATVLGGRTGGAAALLVGGLLAALSFTSQPGDPLRWRELGWGLLSFWALSAAMIWVAGKINAARRREALLNRRLEMVTRELQHRIKNIITLAQALAYQTGRTAIDIPDFRQKLTERLQALAEAQSILAEAGEFGAELGRLVDAVLSPFRKDARIALEPGPDVRVDEQLATTIALLVNELATNAVKYGALSVRDGQVRLNWAVDGPRVRLQWSEHGGPAVAPPRKTGFGTRLLQTAMPRSRGNVHIDYDPAGVRCTVEFEPVHIR